MTFCSKGTIVVLKIPLGDTDVPDLHIKLDPKAHKLLSQKAKECNFNKLDFIERTLEWTARQEGKPVFVSDHPIPKKSAFTFIDLFAGIGGTRLAFEAHKGHCVYSNEWDRFCQRTYLENFSEIPHGDITKVDAASIPDHDILVGGFPCQPFSIAGVSKKKSLGKEHGFKCKAQGTLFFDVLRIIETKRPKMFLLENVKNLKSHDKGNTFRVIEGSLKELGYSVVSEIIDARHWVPQHRERIYIVGFDKEIFGENPKFKFPALPARSPKLGSVLKKNTDKKYTLTDHLWKYLQDYKKKHQAKGNGFGFGLVNRRSVTRTLSARYYKDGSEILIDQGKGKNPRRLSPPECAKLMGFPKDFQIKVSDTQAYKQFGNSVVVPVVTAIAGEMAKTFKKHVKQTRG